MIAQFTLRLIFGMALTWCWMPRSEVTCGFFRIQMLVAVGLGVLGLLEVGSLPAVESATSLLGPMALRILCGVVVVASFLGSVYWTLARRAGGAILCGVVLFASGAALVGGISRELFRTTSSGALAVGSELAAGWLIGGAVTAMLLGHWYLTAPMMKLSPLQRLNLGLGGAALVRGAIAAVAWATLDRLAASSTHDLWLALRWLCGIAAPIIMAVLVRQILRYRNTQSATGVLFAAVILVFIGETTAAVLSRDLRWPL
ncbi:MAG: hypothetical protein KF774_09225 [Planctomyces sp.]|nr:hypothetical protein [Planctomyces sp.]